VVRKIAPPLDPSNELFPEKLSTRVRVTDVSTGKSVVVRIDRGPMVRNRFLDLLLGAARSLGITDRGVARVRAEVLGNFSSPSRKWQDTMSARARHPSIMPPASNAGGQRPFFSRNSEPGTFLEGQSSTALND
jgi:rare lipoprotein A (peptidoglycan hydrolase)